MFFFRLETGSDHQTFSMALPVRLTRQYFKVMRPLYEVSTATTSITKITKKTKTMVCL